MASQSKDEPSMWLIWIHVANVDETVKKATENNGKIISPLLDLPDVGRIAVIQDPTGGVLGVITPETS